MSLIAGVHCDVASLVSTRALVCTRCGYRFSPDDELPIVRTCPKGTNPPKKPVKREPDPPLDCVHRGRELRRELCETCQGTVRIKVLACALEGIGECTIKKSIPGVACCADCTKIQPPVKPTQKAP